MSGATRVCVIGEEMSGELDEGTRKFAYCLLEALARGSETLGISVGGPDGGPRVKTVPASRSFLAPDLRGQLRRFSPDAVCYVPSASLTSFSLLRAWLLGRCVPAAATALVALQPRPHSRFVRPLLSKLAPDVVFAMDSGVVNSARRFTQRVRLLPPGVDTQRFRPATEAEKRRLRRKYGLPESGRVVLHIGHAVPERNLSVLARLAPRAAVVFVEGSSPGRDDWVLDELKSAGVVVIDRYVSAIEELYQAADVYVFPVWDAGGCISVPLSVLEAMACNLPVVTTPFGGLPALFPAGAGLHIATSDSELVQAALEAGAASDTRSLVQPYSWQRVADELLQTMLAGKAGIV